MTTRARDGRRTGAARALGALAAAAAVGAVVLGGLALRRGGAEVVVDAPPAVAATTPPTVAPRVTPPDPAPPPASTAPAPVRSPLADLLGERGSARIEPAAPRPVPVGLAIEALGVLAPVRPVGVEPDGQLEVPDETEVGWYRFGPGPGEPGATVLAAHVSWNQRPGPFARLGRLDPGARVSVGLSDGTARTYEVVERAMYGKLALPAERIWTDAGPETLVLITCGGAFDDSIRRYLDNIVVYAVPVA